MRSFRYALSIALVFVISAAAHAQLSRTAATPIGASAAGLFVSGGVPAATPVPQPSEQHVDLTRFENTKPTIQLALPANISPYTMLSLGERFTLSQSTGYVDSVTFVVDTAVGDSITVGLAPDTLFEVSPGTSYHLMNIWSSVDFGEVTVPVTMNEGRTVVTVPFAHTAVPQNFWVYVAPGIANGTFTSAFTIEGDRGPVVPRTADNTFSGFLALIGTQPYSAILDSTFFDANNEMIYSNLNITAHMSLPPAALASNTAAPKISVYPNPVSDVLTLSGVLPTTTSQIVDALGRVVTRVEGASVSVRDLEPGAYTLITPTGKGVNAEKFVVRH